MVTESTMSQLFNCGRSCTRINYNLAYARVPFTSITPCHVVAIVLYVDLKKNDHPSVATELAWSQVRAYAGYPCTKDRSGAMKFATRGFGRFYLPLLLGFSNSRMHIST